MSSYDLYRNTICKYDDNDYIILFKDDESAKTVFDEFNQKDQRIAELEKYIKGKEIFLSNENITIFAKTFEDYEEIMLREENAVKEFAEELKKKIENDTYILTNLNIDETYCGNKVTKQELFEFIIFDLLKEKGIE